MREKEIEQYLREKVVKAGGMALKFESPGMAGMPDRLILYPSGKVFFVELKAPGKKPRPLQLVRHEELKKIGFPVMVIDSKEKVEVFIDEICSS